MLRIVITLKDHISSYGSVFYDLKLFKLNVKSYKTFCVLLTVHLSIIRCTGRPPTGVMIPDAVQYNFDLLMMSTWCSKHVDAFNRLIIKQDFVHQVG